MNTWTLFNFAAVSQLSPVTEWKKVSAEVIDGFNFVQSE